jgi:hypothetical protein
MGTVDCTARKHPHSPSAHIPSSEGFRRTRSNSDLQ